MKTARIIGTGSYLPLKIETNKDLYKNPEIKENFNIEKAKESLEKNLSKSKISKLTNPEIFDYWTKQVAEINQRHIYTNDFNNNPDFIGPVENMGAEASKKALQASQINPKDLDFINLATFTHEQTVPNPACSIGHLIKADGIPGTHTNNACAGFIYGIIDAYEKIISGTCKNVLVVASEKLSKVTNYNDPKMAIIVADGAGAAVLSADETGILGFSRKSQYEDKHIRIKNKNELNYQNFAEMRGGPKVLANAVRAMSTQTTKALKNANLTLDDIKYIIPHQANGRITRDLAKNLNIPLKKICNIIENIGNTSCSSIPIALDKLVRGELPDYKIKKGDNLVLTAVGIGYTMGAVVMEMGEMRAAT